MTQTKTQRNFKEYEADQERLLVLEERIARANKNIPATSSM